MRGLVLVAAGLLVFGLAASPAAAGNGPDWKQQDAGKVDPTLDKTIDRVLDRTLDAVLGEPTRTEQNARIPAGHLPPAGSCRIWFPDRPAGHQPPPGPCPTLRYQVPPGAFLVQG